MVGSLTHASEPRDGASQKSGAEAVLRVDGLSAAYSRGGSSTTVVDDLSFDIRRGEVRGVVGESGSGKSTLAASIMGVMPAGGRVVSGTVAFGGTDLVTQSEDALRELRGNDIGFIPQNPMSAMNPVFSVGWQLREAIEVHRSSKDKDKDQTEQIINALAAVGIGDGREKIRNYPHELSGGMRQRVLIAMSILNDPALLIADEPTTALDATIQAQILDLLKGLVKARHMSMLLITHDMGVIAAMCDRVLVMYAGEIVEDGTVGEIFARPQHPYTMALLRSAGDVDPKTGRFQAIAGAPATPAEAGDGCRFRDRCPLAIDKCATHPDLLAVAEDHSSRCWVAQERRLDSHEH